MMTELTAMKDAFTVMLIAARTHNADHELQAAIVDALEAAKVLEAKVEKVNDLLVAGAQPTEPGNLGDLLADSLTATFGDLG